MTILQRIRLDFSPAFWAYIALWAGLEVCGSFASDDDLPWSVFSAYTVGIFSTSTWWMCSDSIRRGYPLMPAWGSYFAFFGAATVLVYLFRSRGAWAFLTIALYLLTFLLVSFAISFLY